MATKRKPGTVAAVNRAIDAMNRKQNPQLREVYGQFEAYGKRRFFGPSQNEWGIANGFPFELESVSVHGNPPIAFSKTRAYVCVDEDEKGPVVEVWPIRNLKHPGVPNMSFAGWNRNPVNTTKLVRRKANPDKRSPYVLREKKKESFPRFVLEMKDKERDPWMPRESFKSEDEARKAAQTWAKHYPSLWLRVVDLKSI